MDFAANKNSGAKKSTPYVSLFKRVKAEVTARQAAEFYGMQVKPCGLALCPFHPDRNPSLQLDERYYCHGCHVTGDVTDLVAYLFNLKPYDAAKKIAYDFGIDPDSPFTLATVKKNLREQKHYQSDEERWSIEVLSEYSRLLEKWSEDYFPKKPDDDPNPYFILACRDRSLISYLLDCLFDQDDEVIKQTVDDVITYMFPRIQTSLQSLDDYPLFPDKEKDLIVPAERA